MNDYKEIDYKDYYNLPSLEGKYKIIEYYENGNIWREQYFTNGKYHREAGPTIIEYYTNGNISCKEYFINSKYHREDGPAYITYNKNGNIESERYNLYYKYFTKEEYYSPKIQAILDIVKMMDTWEQKYNFIELSLKI